MPLTFDITVVHPASGVMAGLHGTYARATLAGPDRDGQIYSAAGDTPWEAIAGALDSYHRRVVLRLRPNGAPLDDDFGADPFPPPRAPLGGERDSNVPGTDESDPLARAMAGLALWGAR